MNILTLDFETYYSQEYSLSKMTTEAYVRDPAFEAILLGIKVGTDASFTLRGPDIPAYLASVDWSNTCAVAHHAHFDGLILSYHYGVKPAYWMDTLSMGRALVGAEVGGSLAKLSEHFGIGRKGHEVLDAKGKHASDFTPEELDKYAAYCANDVELTFQLLRHLLSAKGILPSKFPQFELDLIDLTVRLFTEPVAELDTALLEHTYIESIRAKDAFLQSAGLDEKTLKSKSKLAAVLRQLGVEPPMKPSPTHPEKMIEAFSKTDKEFLALLQHDDPRVSAVVEARLGTQSSLVESRAERMLNIAARGPMPVYLKYYGAHTGRWCLAGDTRIWVRTPSGVVMEMPLVSLRPDEEVWDGQEWVKHDGLVDQGIAEVITYDGITGTPEHKVWVAGEDATRTLAGAMQEGLILQDADAPPRN